MRHVNVVVLVNSAIVITQLCLISMNKYTAVVGEEEECSLCFILAVLTCDFLATKLQWIICQKMQL